MGTRSLRMPRVGSLPAPPPTQASVATQGSGLASCCSDSCSQPGKGQIIPHAFSKQPRMPGTELAWAPQHLPSKGPQPGWAGRWQVNSNQKAAWKLDPSPP